MSFCCFCCCFTCVDCLIFWCFLCCFFALLVLQWYHVGDLALALMFMFLQCWQWDLISCAQSSANIYQWFKGKGQTISHQYSSISGCVVVGDLPQLKLIWNNAVFPWLLCCCFTILGCGKFCLYQPLCSLLLDVLRMFFSFRFGAGTRAFSYSLCWM